MLQRVEAKAENIISEELKEDMSGIIFDKLKEIDSLALLSPDKSQEYRKSQEFQKIKGIVRQYITKYEKDLNTMNASGANYQSFEERIKE